jgi:hypothetical protein
LELASAIRTRETPATNTFIALMLALAVDGGKHGPACLSPADFVDSSMPERTQRPSDPMPWGPKQGEGDGPRSPDISRPDTQDLLKKMRKVDPNQSKRYRQRTGQ